jgi:hypothetical protein
MRGPLFAFDEALPMRIERSEFEDPSLLIGGPSWSLSVTCCWRWISSTGVVNSPGMPAIEDRVWNLVGDTIVAAEWLGRASVGVDPWFELSSGGSLQLFSDAAFDTWVLDLADHVLVGPLRLSP